MLPERICPSNLIDYKWNTKIMHWNTLQMKNSNLESDCIVVITNYFRKNSL